MSNKKLNIIDIKENNIVNIDPNILSILLMDRTTNRNIIWATDNYKSIGKEYEENEEIKIELITGKNGDVIKPRTAKAVNEKARRSREKAEVFTPSWMCNIQNNLVDNEWFEQKNVFNTELKHSWKVNKDKIKFPENKSWEEYVKNIRLEITCGEAPYIVSRYDTVTGKNIPIKERIGLLDRKLRIISENITTKEDWLKWAEIACKSIYAYDWQGDNILIARENVLFTLLEYYRENFKEELEKENVIKFAEIISWNIWQMDGVRCVIPNSCTNGENKQLSLFKTQKKNSDKCVGCETKNVLKHNGKYCKIMDWEKEKKIRFVKLIKTRRK